MKRVQRAFICFATKNINNQFELNKRIIVDDSKGEMGKMITHMV